MSRVDLKQDYEERPKSKSSSKQCRDNRLHELEEQLEFAESRCGTLKQQLNYIKILYGCDRKTPDPNVIENDNPTSEAHGDNNDVRHLSYDDLTKWNQQKVAYGGGEGGKNVLTQSASYTTATTRISTVSSNNKDSSKSSAEKTVIVTTDRKASKSKENSRIPKTKRKRYTRKFKTRVKTKSADVSTKYNNGNISSQEQSRSQIFQDPVIEIYKNTAINHVQSEGRLDTAIHKRIKSNEMRNDVKKRKISGSKKNVTECSSNDTDFQMNKKFSEKSLKEESVQTEEPSRDFKAEDLKLGEYREELNEETRDRDSNSARQDSSEAIKSYCQPTISSKRKQVERSMFTNINVRNIPFIAATSTAPSHNIGVNIQQVLSIMKKRHPAGENHPSSDLGSGENSLLTFLNCKTTTSKTTPGGQLGFGDQCPFNESRDVKKTCESVKSNMSYWRSTSDSKGKDILTKESATDSENGAVDWSFRVNKLKKVLVFLHEDFTALSQKYKRLKKKLTKRNINKNDAKGELAEIERNLEKKEEEITVIIALYKEILNLREELKKLQEKPNFVNNSKTIIAENLKPTSSTHVQMTSLLRKIQNFQEQLKI